MYANKVDVQLKSLSLSLSLCPQYIYISCWSTYQIKSSNRNEKTSATKRACAWTCGKSPIFLLFAREKTDKTLTNNQPAKQASKQPTLPPPAPPTTTRRTRRKSTLITSHPTTIDPDHHDGGSVSPSCFGFADGSRSLHSLWGERRKGAGKLHIKSYSSCMWCMTFAQKTHICKDYKYGNDTYIYIYTYIYLSIYLSIYIYNAFQTMLSWIFLKEEPFDTTNGWIIRDKSSTFQQPANPSTTENPHDVISPQQIRKSKDWYPTTPSRC